MGVMSAIRARPEIAPVLALLGLFQARRDQDESGLVVVEWIIIIGLVAVAVIAIVTMIVGKIQAKAGSVNLG